MLEEYSLNLHFALCVANLGLNIDREHLLELVFRLSGPNFNQSDLQQVDDKQAQHEVYLLV